MDNIECEHCGGTEFYKEAGFYFCKGCQVQSQEVQEYVFDDFAAEAKTGSRKLKSDKDDKTNSSITSWECYNHILLGLTEELINLGAQKKLKAVVKILWMQYLEKLEVFRVGGEDRLPKLQALCSEKDAEIVYGKLVKRRRRRKSSSSEVDVTTLDSSSMKQERKKRKRALVKAQYEDFSQKSEGTPSLHNETLESLQSSDKSRNRARPVSYNISASRVLRRFHKSRYHWRKHTVDFDKTLKCHKSTYRRLPYKYRVGPCVLSLNKLYSILYLGLLILKDKIQLGDILRFIKEGQLSFNCYSHFFPEDFCDKSLNFRNFKKFKMFANGPMRAITSEMSVVLGADYYVSRPDLVELSERYCKELNLPQEICICVQNLLSKVGVKMSFRKRANKVPNYEGRVLSMILFVLKLLFGLDDITEFHLGTYAAILNRSRFVEPKMFNVVEWLKYIEYRDHVMAGEHFPTSFDKNDEPNVNLSVGALGKKRYPEEVRVDGSKDNYKRMLSRLKSEIGEPENVELPVTLTPFFDFMKLIPKSKYLDLLSKDFSCDSLEHILRPSGFLEILNDRLEVVHGGANNNWVQEKVICNFQKKKEELKEKRRLVTVKLTLGRRSKRQHQEPEAKISHEEYMSNFYTTNEANFTRNTRRLRKYTADCDFEALAKDLEVAPEEYPEHYNPYERFWMRTKLRLDLKSQQECRKFLETFPHNFRVVFKECQRIAQQNEQEFLSEYQMTELHLVYSVSYGKKTCKQNVIKDRLIANYLNNTKDLW